MSIKTTTTEIGNLAVKTAGECLAGRLVALSKSGNELEPKLSQEISIIQDPEKGVSAGIYVTGNIPVESDDGYLYENRNRLALCRCGRSRNMPFCDGSHASFAFVDSDVLTKGEA